MTHQQWIALASEMGKAADKMQDHIECYRIYVALETFCKSAAMVMMRDTIDTAQQDHGPQSFDYKAGRVCGLDEMRERAAKLVEKQWPATPMETVAERIRDLPISTEESDDAQVP